MLERVAYIIFILMGLGWLAAMIFGMIQAMPFGLIGLLVFAAIGMLFFKVFKERMQKAKHDRYSRDVEQ